MLAELVRIADGWPLALSLATALTARGLSAGRRRMALNEALHELRRPLQSLVLSFPAAPGHDDLSRQTAAALARLEREINGETVPAAPEAISLPQLLAAAASRWRRAAERAGGSLALGAAPNARVRGERGELERALDNLIVNAIEHGGAEVVVAAALGEGCTVRVSVHDRGNGLARRDALARRGWREAPRRLASALARLGGRCRRGHGLRVVRRVADRHGGKLRLRPRGEGTEAVLELPLLDGGERA